MKSSPSLLTPGKSPPYQILFDDIVQLIHQGQQRVAREFNSTMVLVYWSIGKRLHEEVLRDQRADYGDRVIEATSAYLSTRFGKGYSRSALFRMVKVFRMYPDQEKVATASQQLSWSHMIMLCQLEDPLQRSFYEQMSCLEKWSVRTLRTQIQGMLFERTSLSQKPDEVMKATLTTLEKTQSVTPQVVFKDPYFLDFIGLTAPYSETDLEKAILDHMVDFLQELGSDFCFVARQKRLSTQRKDRYLDLLFFHRGLRRLIAIELKLGDFEPAHKGQMEWYLRWLDKNERKEGEEAPLGIILCANKDQEDVEYLELDQAGIHVSQYLTQLPPKEILEQKLHTALAQAKHRHEALSLASQES